MWDSSCNSGDDLVFLYLAEGLNGDAATSGQAEAKFGAVFFGSLLKLVPFQESAEGNEAQA